ncbi:RNA polymerase sigma-70 factor [Chitinophaga lutea]
MGVSANGKTKWNASMAETLFREYYARLCHYAFQFTRDAETARDVAQESFVTYLGRQDEVAEHPNAVRDFLYTTVRNACLNRLRHEKVVRRFEQEQAAASPTEEPRAMQAMIRSEVLAAIHGALDTLPEACARIVRMGYIDGLRNQQIAEALDISINTVKTQKRRGLEMLRLRLPPELYLVVLAGMTYF